MNHTLVFSPEAPAPIGPYSQAVSHGGLVYVSGQIALDAQTGLMHEADLETETHQVLKNLQAVLTAAGSSMAKVLKCTIFITDMGQFARINQVYGQYFASQPPARETVQVSALPKGANVEISCIAYI